MENFNELQNRKRQREREGVEERKKYCQEHTHSEFDKKDHSSFCSDDLKEQSQEKNKPDDSQEDDTEDSLEDDIEESLEDDINDSQVAEPNVKCNKKDLSDIFCGTHETQVSEGGEADLRFYNAICKKNPGHKQFIPVNDFNINHLPEGNHDNLLVEYIKDVADLTVRVAVKMTSTERPEFWPNTKQPYAFYNMRGSDVMRVGTGWVWNVKIEYNWGTCQCPKCQHSDTPSKVRGDVWMYTARHVVFDDLEARHTSCRLFYDRKDSPLVTLGGWTVIGADIEEDRCVLKCVTCDVDLLDKLEQMLEYWRDLSNKVNNKYERRGDKLIWIVSHPHGCTKQISVGHWIDKYEVSGNITKYTYTACTCPGSSGAYVHPLGYVRIGLLHDYHVHSGVNFEGRNFSGSGWYWR